MDLFIGSGTAAVVAARLGWRFVGCELDAAAIDVARARVASTKLRDGVSGQRLPLVTIAQFRALRYIQGVVIHISN